MTEHLDYDAIRADTVRQVAKLMAAAAITAPKSGGQLFLQGKHLFIETVIVDDAETLHSWPAGCGPGARNAEKRSGSATPTWPKPSMRCSSSGWPTGTHPTTTAAPAATPPAPSSSTPPNRFATTPELEFVGPTCNLRDIDLGIAVGSAAKTAAIHSIDCRCQTRIAVAARKLGIIHADIAVALSLSLTHKAVGFDRKIGEVDFDALDLPSTGTLPIGIEGAPRADGARNRQQTRRPIRPASTRDQLGSHPGWRGDGCCVHGGGVAAGRPRVSPTVCSSPLS